MSSPRVRRLLTIPLACALSLTAAAEVAGQVLPELPSVPQVQLPSLPKPPPLKPPSQLEVPSVPQAPTVPVPRSSVPSLSAPETAVTPQSTSAASPRPGAATPAGTPAGASTGSASAQRSAARAKRRRAVATPRERRFRRSVKTLWACSYAVGDFERNVLVRRAGLDGFSAASAAAVASRLGVSVHRVRTAQTRGLRQLRGANRADGCAMSAPTGNLGGSAKTLLAIATAPPLASDAGDAVAKAPERSSANDRVEVLGARRASTGVKAAVAPRATVTLASAGDAGSTPWLLAILALLALAASSLLLLRRRLGSAPEAQAPPLVEPQVVEPQVVEPQVVEPQVVEPQVVEPQVVEPPDPPDPEPGPPPLPEPPWRSPGS